jgi:hypothetical protein
MQLTHLIEFTDNTYLEIVSNVTDVEGYEYFELWSDPGITAESSASGWVSYIAFLHTMLNPSAYSSNFLFELEFNSVTSNGSDDDVLNLAEYLTTFTNGQTFLKLTTYTDKLIDGKTIREIGLTGSFMKLLNCYPKQFLSFSPSLTKTIQLNWNGHDFILLRCMETRDNLDATNSNKWGPPSNILTLIPTPGKLGTFLTYDRSHTGSLSSVGLNNISSLTFNFEDRWGDPAYGIVDFAMEITIDFVKLGNLIQDMSMQDVKRMRY